VVAAAFVTVGVFAGPAHAGVYLDQPNTNTVSVYSSAYASWTYLSAVIDSSHKASHASMSTNNGAGVNSRAKCQRGDGGTQWYQSSIRATYQSGDSHYDCDNNGTYNRAVVAIGAYMS
jgi:hypothetical protein